MTATMFPGAPCSVDGCERDGGRRWQLVRDDEGIHRRRWRCDDAATIVFDLPICVYHDGIIDLCYSRGRLLITSSVRHATVISTLELPKISRREWNRARRDALSLLRRLSN